MDIQEIGTLMAITVGGLAGFILGFAVSWIIQAKTRKEHYI